MVATVVDFPGITKLDIPAERILDRAVKADLTDVVVIGYTKEGERYFASSYASGPEVLWLLENAKHDLITVVE